MQAACNKVDTTIRAESSFNENFSKKASAKETSGIYTTRRYQTHDIGNVDTISDPTSEYPDIVPNIELFLENPLSGITRYWVLVPYYPILYLISGQMKIGHTISGALSG
jgi:hypothetical protein